MRLNRNSVIFIALLAVVIVVALIFLQDDEGADDQPAVEATTETIQLFADVSPATVSSLMVSEIGVVDADATPEPDTETSETTDATLSLTKDAESGLWVSTETVDGTIDSAQVETAIQALVNLRSNRQFTPADADYAQFGLDNPTYDVSFTGQPATDSGVASPDSDAVTYRLLIGDRTVGENGYYAFVNDDSETIYVITNVTTLQNSVLNLASNVPLEPTLVPTVAPVLNPQAPFAEFVLTNATDFSFTDHNNDASIIVERSPDNTEWIYTDNGAILPVQQESLQVILNNFSTIRGVDEVQTDDLASLGLDSPHFTLIANTVDGRSFTLQLGDQDPTDSFYYALVNDFESVVLVDSDSVVSLVSLFESPPPLIEPEATPEVTAETSD